MIEDEDHNPFMSSVFDRVDAREGETVGISYKNDFLKLLGALLGYFSSSIFAAWLVVRCYLTALPEKVSPGAAERISAAVSSSTRLMRSRGREYYIKFAMAAVKGNLMLIRNNLLS